MASLNYEHVLHNLTLIEAHARAARDALAQGMELRNNPPGPKLALAGQTAGPTPQQIESMSQQSLNVGFANANKAIEHAAKLEGVMRGEAPKA